MLPLLCSYKAFFIFLFSRVECALPPFLSQCVNLSHTMFEAHSAHHCVQCVFLFFVLLFWKAAWEQHHCQLSSSCHPAALLSVLHSVRNGIYQSRMPRISSQCAFPYHYSGCIIGYISPSAYLLLNVCLCFPWTCQQKTKHFLFYYDMASLVWTSAIVRTPVFSQLFV